ncbi:sensor histidine kinase [Micromonospora sp. CB01531]|uniref:sensor histidine kinase n=1 Tax=Micromonospora sp. CB01531 TaxID=1718947 RepID=UPI00093EEC8E|nr:histidine kinase [Micromonospora sp. CB01531]OKI41210.1 hypothetical protein A6A27_39400 [Micromonospora sp. CB01531]
MTGRLAFWLLIGLHLPIVAVPVCFTMLGAADVPAPQYAVAAAPIGLAMLGLQLRHSLSTTRQRRPAGWRWTLPVLVVLGFAPLLLPGWLPVWTVGCWFPLASTLMLLRGRVRVAVHSALSVACVAALLAVQARSLGPALSASATALVYAVLYDALSLVPPWALFGAARLVRLLDELHAARHELAELAVTRERLRLSQDLHDVLGQNLSAVSLQGDLALRLLTKDPSAARSEVEQLAGLARDTLRSMRAVTHDEHRVSLRTELDGATALLVAAGVTVTVETADGELSAGTQEVFAWTVREGVTNVLRHSDAQWCSIGIQRHDGLVRLTVRNNGAGTPLAATGSGLNGIAARAAARGGSAHGRHIDDHAFELVVDLPEEAQ